MPTTLYHQPEGAPKADILGIGVTQEGDTLIVKELSVLRYYDTDLLTITLADSTPSSVGRALIRTKEVVVEWPRPPVTGQRGVASTRLRIVATEGDAI
jgi:hypothetical protein